MNWYLNRHLIDAHEYCSFLNKGNEIFMQTQKQERVSNCCLLRVTVAQQEALVACLFVCLLLSGTGHSYLQK